jgi:AmpD protein
MSRASHLAPADRQPPAFDPGGAWLLDARRVPSPNCDDRPAGTGIELVVVHGISLPPGVFGGGHVEALFTNRLDPGAHPYFATIAALRVSSHLYIERTGALVQFVAFDRRAWHAGDSTFRGRARCNDFSIGIELEGADEAPYAPAQYERLSEVLRVLMRRWPVLDASRIVGHCDIAPGRKSDPGPAFDWARLRAALDIR